MSMQYVRDTYGVPAKRGLRVRVKVGNGWRDGTITSATHYVHVRPDGFNTYRMRVHPTDAERIQYPEVR